MNLFVWLLLGSTLGGLASVLGRREIKRRLLPNMLVGVVGAVLSGWLLVPAFAGGPVSRSDLNLAAILVPLIGALILLALVNLFNRGTSR